MTAGENCFNMQICKLFSVHAQRSSWDGEGRHPSWKEAKDSERTVLFSKGKLSTPWDPTGELCLSGGQLASPTGQTKKTGRGPEDGLS